MSRLPQPDDAQLVQRCREGDEQAWHQLVDRYECLVYSVALGCGLDRDSAADVFQGVWIELFRSLDRLRNPQALARWLMVSTRRRAYRHALVHARRVEGVFDEMVDPEALPDEKVEAVQARLLLENCLERLGEPCASLLRMLFLQADSPSYKTIAENADIPVGSIGPTRARCLTRLRKVMRTRGRELETTAELLRTKEARG